MNDTTQKYSWILTCAPGLEELLQNELQQRLGWDLPFTTDLGALSCEAPLEFALDVCASSLVCSRVLFQVRSFSAKTPEMLYDQVRRVPWERIFLSPKHPGLKTFAVFSHGRPPYFAMSFASLKIKDAVCDEIRKKGLERPDIDRKEPQLRIEAFFDSQGKCQLSLDFSGEPLHRRGYRAETVEAPLRENKAAALIAFSGWNPKNPFYDPFCGSGTLPIEGYLYSKNASLGLRRLANRPFPLETYFKEFETAKASAVERAKARYLKDFRPQIQGSDIDPKSLRQAGENAQRAGIRKEELKFFKLDARELPELPKDTHIVCHPPFGMRSFDESKAAALIARLTEQLKKSGFEGALTLVVPQGPLEKAVGLRPSRKLKVEDGKVTLKFLHYDLYKSDGKKSKPHF